MPAQMVLPMPAGPVQAHTKGVVFFAKSAIVAQYFFLG